MLNNLFSSFDSKNFFLPLLYMLNMYVMVYFSFFKKSMIMMYMYKKYYLYIYMNIMKDFFFYMLFSFVFLLNFFSLNFFSFSMTSQISLNLFMILILWSPIMLMSFTKMNNSLLIHILPLGTPNMLIFMMILIEFMSFLIRPLTLILRLSINMIAGHVLVHLISSTILMDKLYLYLLMYLYMLMKFLVSLIQSYIIITLLNLYIEEI